MIGDGNYRIVAVAADISAVQVGCVVAIRYEGDTDVERYLVGSIEERGALPVLSPGSPLGSQLLGAKVGDTVAFEAPGGTLRVDVVAIEPAD
jgi:transcription elongation factor GreA